MSCIQHVRMNKQTGQDQLEQLFRGHFENAWQEAAQLCIDGALSENPATRLLYNNVARASRDVHARRIWDFR